MGTFDNKKKLKRSTYTKAMPVSCHEDNAAAILSLLGDKVNLYLDNTLPLDTVVVSKDQDRSEEVHDLMKSFKITVFTAPF